MGKTQGMIHPKVKFHHRHEPMKPGKLFNSKIQWCNKQRTDIPFPKGKNWKEERGDGSQASSKPSKANTFRL